MRVAARDTVKGWVTPRAAPRRDAPRPGRPPSFRGRGTIAPLRVRRSKGNRGGVGTGSTELAEVLALPLRLAELQVKPSSFRAYRDLGSKRLSHRRRCNHFSDRSLRGNPAAPED